MPPGRVRYAAIAAGYMYLFKLSWELPYDDPERLRRRLLIDAPIRFDTFVGRGGPGPAAAARAAQARRGLGARRRRDGRLRLVVRAAPAAGLPAGATRAVRAARRWAPVGSPPSHDAVLLAVARGPAVVRLREGRPHGRRVDRVARRSSATSPPPPARGRRRRRQPLGLDAVRSRLVGGDHRDGLGELGPSTARSGGGTSWPRRSRSSTSASTTSPTSSSGLRSPSSCGCGEPVAAPFVRATARAVEP